MSGNAFLAGTIDSSWHIRGDSIGDEGTGNHVGFFQRERGAATMKTITSETGNQSAVLQYESERQYTRC
ncbi:MAG: hypothetical protein AAF483_20810 [Planctomycetota bacterium]